MFTTGTDITTAVTNLINTGTLIIILLILLKKSIKRKQDITWIIAFIMFILVSITGFIIHGLKATQDPEINAFLRKILMVELSFMMAFYVISVICDIYGEKIYRRVLGLCLIPAVIFIATSITIMNLTTYKNGFMVFAIYCILNQLVIIIILIRHLHDRTGLNLYLIASIFLVIANVVQRMKFIKFRVRWDFNYDSVYHFLLFIFIILQYSGICRLRKSTDMTD